MDSLRPSALGDDDLDEEAISDETDLELANVERQITDAESALDNITENSQRRKSQYDKELTELWQKIESAKQIAADALERQKNSHQSEIANIVDEFEQRMQALKLSFQRNLDQNTTFEQIRQEISDLGNETKLTDQKRILEQERAKAQELNSIAEVNLLQKALKRRDSRNTAILTVKRLEQEICELQSSRREFLSETRLKVTDLIAQIDLKKRDHYQFVRNLERDLLEREQQFHDRISILQQQIERERLQTEYEVKSATEKCENLQKVYQAISRRGNQQLSQLEADVQKLKRAIEMAEKGEEKLVLTSRDEMSKLHSLELETQSILLTRAGLIQLNQTETRNRQVATVLKQRQTSNTLRDSSVRKNAIFS
jgi:hypothetical protein